MHSQPSLSFSLFFFPFLLLLKLTLGCKQMSIFNLSDLFLIQSQPTPLNLTLNCSPKRAKYTNFFWFLLLCSIFHFLYFVVGVLLSLLLLLLLCCAVLLLCTDRREKAAKNAAWGRSMNCGRDAQLAVHTPRTRTASRSTHTERKRAFTGLYEKAVRSRMSCHADTLCFTYG